MCAKDFRFIIYSQVAGEYNGQKSITQRFKECARNNLSNLKSPLPNPLEGEGSKMISLPSQS